MAELNRLRLSAVFTADTELDVLLDLSAFFNGDLHKCADTGLIDRDKRIILEDTFFYIEWQEPSCVVP